MPYTCDIRDIFDIYSSWDFNELQAEGILFFSALQIKVFLFNKKKTLLIFFFKFVLQNIFLKHNWKKNKIKTIIHFSLEFVFVERYSFFEIFLLVEIFLNEGPFQKEKKNWTKKIHFFLVGKKFWTKKSSIFLLNFFLFRAIFDFWKCFAFEFVWQKRPSEKEKKLGEKKIFFLFFYSTKKNVFVWIFFWKFAIIFWSENW